MENDKHIIDLISKMPTVQTPDDFTPRVMEAVRQTRGGAFGSVHQFFSSPRVFASDSIRAMSTGINNEKRCLNFLLLGFAHSVLAIILFLGLDKVEMETVISPLFVIPPWVSLFLAVWLGFWGYFLKRNPKTGINWARFAALVYMEIAVISGVLLMMQFKGTLLLIPFFATAVGLSVAAGIFLAITCHNENGRSNNGSSILV